MREADPTLSELQRALLGYDPSSLEKNLIDWTRERWKWAARGMVYARKEAAETVEGVGGVRSDEGKLVLEVAARVAIAERELLIRALAHLLPEWIESTTGSPRSARTTPTARPKNSRRARRRSLARRDSPAAIQASHPPTSTPTRDFPLSKAHRAIFMLVASPGRSQ